MQSFIASARYGSGIERRDLRRVGPGSIAVATCRIETKETPLEPNRHYRLELLGSFLDLYMRRGYSAVAYVEDLFAYT
jgi:hypothetical protein